MDFKSQNFAIFVTFMQGPFYVQWIFWWKKHHLVVFCIDCTRITIKSLKFVIKNIKFAIRNMKFVIRNMKFSIKKKIYRVSQGKLFFFNYLWEIEICKLDFFGRCFWNSEIWEILLMQPVFMKCILCAIYGQNLQPFFVLY